MAKRTIVRRKYSTGWLIFWIIFFFPGAILQILMAEKEIIEIDE